jgi:protein-S-isoprenylcysteine O-methyltransferase Ste14
MRVSVLTLLAGIAVVVMVTSGALLVVLAVSLEDRWEPMGNLVLAVGIALLMLGLQLLSWSLSLSDEHH